MELFSHTPIVSLIGIEYMVLFSSIVIRLVIKDSYTYKKTNRERREFDRGEKSRKVRLLLPYSALKENCYAPRHMCFFQFLRRINWSLGSAEILLYIGNIWLPQLANIASNFMMYIVLPYFLLIMSYSLINGRRKKSPAKCKKNYRIIDLDNFKNP